jgi:hypothetical protein
VQRRHAVGRLLVQAGLEHLVQRHQEQVRPLDGLQQPLAVAAAGDGVAQRPTEPLQHRRRQQELPNLVGLAVQHLLGEVVQHEAVAAGEPLHEPGRVGVPLQRQRGQLHPGRPQAWRQPVEQQRDAVVHRPRVDEVVVVQDQRHVALDRQERQLVDHEGRQRLRRQLLRADGQRGGLLPQAGSDPVERPRDGAPEPRRVVVAAVQRQPGDRPAAAPGPVAEQGGLAEPGRGAHHREPTPHPPGEAFEQAGARHQSRLGTWNLVASSASRLDAVPSGGLLGGDWAIGPPHAGTGRGRHG